jgi:hypothetical protein
LRICKEKQWRQQWAEATPHMYGGSNARFVKLRPELSDTPQSPEEVLAKIFLSHSNNVEAAEILEFGLREFRGIDDRSPFCPWLDDEIA